jgi:hypothetical protein
MKKFNSILAKNSTMANESRCVSGPRRHADRGKNYLHRPEEVELFPGTGAALKRLAAPVSS